MNMIILEIFQSTMKTVTDMLDKKNDKINYDLQKYICECVKIYKEMYKTYCRNKDEDNKSELTCSTLNTVKQTYNWFLSGKSYKNYYIPSLDKDNVEYLAMCPQDNPGSELTPKADATVSLSSSLSGVRDGYTVGIPSPGGDNNDEADSFSSSTAVNVENQASSMSRSVSTAVGTVAGASSILALLYKFTPGRNWIRSGIRGSRGRISSNLYEDVPNELLFDGLQGEDMSSYNARYNIGYGSVRILE
ncbi:Plasmodium vivax Vir protein, putative [Plasmodium vivax]|uniref:Vir protein, putative n=1 Tax=Plasmodium vivax TaxID=5855 RepID=A0A1G4HDL2_PLAVI|nr:Plasmodium vivax Vir protein, putative [Plasmodium vivax]